jgi:phage gp36-like protein
VTYATPLELRDRYRRDDVDEFAHIGDTDLAQALVAASAEVDSWLPGGDLSSEDTAVIKDKALTLARMLAHQDSALSVEHPIVRDAKEVRDWLKALAAGRVKLPSYRPEATQGGSSIAAPTREMVYDTALWSTYRL